MYDINRDPIINTIYNGIKRGIRVTIENKCYASAVILVLSGIDIMAYLNMPKNQQNVKQKDFVVWADRYIKFPCKEQLTGLDFYGSRCGMLHTYGLQSSLYREGKCRQVAYMDKSVPEVRYNSSVSNKLVLVSIEALAESFFKGVDQFLIDSFKNEERAKVVEERLKLFVQTLPCYGN